MRFGTGTICDVNNASLLVKSEHSGGPLLPGFGNTVQHKRVKTEWFALALSPGNNKCSCAAGV